MNSKKIKSFLFRMYREHDLVILLLLTLFCFSWLGIDRPFAPPDEARYVEIPREMVETGDWLTPRLNGVKYFEKPPLMYWLHACLISFFGTTEWVMRLVPAFFGWIGVISTYLFGKSFFGRDVGLWAATILATSALYMGLSRLIILDMPVSVFITIAMMCFYQAIHTRKRVWFYAMTIAFAGGMMTKGLMAIVVPLPIMGLWMLFKRVPLRPFYPFSCLALFLLLVAPWHILICLKNPEFFHKYFIVEHVLRYTTMLHKRYQPFWFFIPVLFVGMLPWSFIAIKSFKWKGHFLFLSLWVVWFIFFFSLSKSKLIPYILPVFPPFALLVAYQIQTIKTFKTTGFGFISMGIIGFFATMLLENIDYSSIHVHEPGIGLLGVIGLFFCIITGISIYFFKKKALLVLGLSLPYLMDKFALEIQHTSTKPLAKIIQEKHCLGDKIACFQTYYQDLPLYTKKRVTIIDYVGELEFGASVEDTTSWIVPSCKNLKKTWIIARKDRWENAQEQGKIMGIYKDLILIYKR